jgi:polar amino acid transport system permease protein
MNQWDWEFAFRCLPALLAGLRITILATVLGMALALVGGLLLALLRRSRVRAIGGAAALLVEFVRGTPLLVQIYFLFYVMPRFGLTMSPMVTGVLALGIHYSAYTSEVYRAGLEAVPSGQWDASLALGLSRRTTLARVIVPQAIRPVIPALGNYLVAMLKDTPLLSTITVLELLQTAKGIGSETFRYLEPMTLVGIIFLIVSLIAAGGLRMIEHHFQKEKLA